MLSHKITGLDAMRHRLETLPDAARSTVSSALSSLGQEVSAEIQAMFDHALPGVSAPGTPPADASGRLAASVSIDTDPENARSVVSVSAPFAFFLEYGTVRMAARPFLRPAALRAGRGALARLATALRQGLQT